MYADNLCLLYRYNENLVCKIFGERDASLIGEFSRINKLVLNHNKTKLVRFKSQPSRFYGEEP